MFKKEKNLNAVALGRLGGLKNLKNNGIEHFKKIGIIGRLKIKEKKALLINKINL